jgi:hypothetical protein
MRIILVCCTILFVVFSVTCGGGTKVSLALEKEIFAPGVEIGVTFTAPASFDQHAWVGIIPSNVPHGSEETNDQYDLDWQYLEKKTSGVLVFRAPGQAGKYDFRMHDGESEGAKEVAHISFEVVIFKEGAELTIENSVVAPGEEIAVSFKAPAEWGSAAWVGIIPSDIPHGSESKNDEHDLDYYYLEMKTAGVLIFTAPEEPGSYDFRMHDTDNNGNEITYVTFEVKAITVRVLLREAGAHFFSSTAVTS